MNIIKRYLYIGLAIFVIFIIFLVASKSKEAGKNEIKIEQLQEKSIQKDIVINNQKSTNEIQQKQKQIIAILNVHDDYVDKFLRWVWGCSDDDNK